VRDRIVEMLDKGGMQEIRDILELNGDTTTGVF
jgi:hypothetical protein